MPVYTLILVSEDGREVVQCESGARVPKPGSEILVGDRWWLLMGSPLAPETESETFVCSPVPASDGEDAVQTG